MKKSNLFKVCTILVIAVMIALVLGTTVNAATDNNTFNDLSNTLRTNNSGNTNTNSNSNSNTNTNSNTNRANTNTNNNNGSVYNSNNLPDTGIESSIPIALLIVIFAISSVYAYKKINDYKNI